MKWNCFLPVHTFVPNHHLTPAIRWLQPALSANVPILLLPVEHLLSYRFCLSNPKRQLTQAHIGLLHQQRQLQVKQQLHLQSLSQSHGLVAVPVFYVCLGSLTTFANSKLLLSLVTLASSLACACGRLKLTNTMQADMRQYTCKAVHDDSDVLSADCHSKCYTRVLIP